MRLHVPQNCKLAQVPHIRSLTLTCAVASVRYNSEAVSPSMRAEVGKRRLRPREDGVPVTVYEFFACNLSLVGDST